MPISRLANIAGDHSDGVALSRSPASASQRTPHNEISRPSSSASSHRPSSRTTSRPLSSASTRPASRIANGPLPKFSQRLPSRQMSRIMSLGHTLVSQVTGLHPDDDHGAFHSMLDVVSRCVDYNAKAAPSSSMRDITKQLHGRTERARVNSQDPWADALHLTFSLLKSQVEKTNDIDSEITLAHLPDHLTFLMLLSVPPTQSTVEHAENYLCSGTPRTDSVSVSWKTILDEEPFEGQHWEGVYGLPHGSTVEGWETRSLDSTPPYSPLPLDNFSDFSPSLSSVDSLPAVESEPSNRHERSDHMTILSTFGHRQLVEDLQARQYWRKEWRTDASLEVAFAIKDGSTFGPSADRLLGELNPSDPHKITYIHEHDAVREILMAFQGYKNSFLRWARSEDGTFSFEPTLDAPRVIHLTRAAQLSVTQSFMQTASTVEHLRRFITCASRRTTSHAIGRSLRVTRTMEAFSEAVELQIGRFMSWCATRERDINLSLAGNGTPLTVSFLNLEKAVRDSFASTFDALLEVLRKVMGIGFRWQDKNMEVWMLLDLPMRFSPFTISTLLLDTLLTAADSSSSNGDTETSKALIQVFSASAEPMWTMIGLWLKHGMPSLEPTLGQGRDSLTPLDDEFFIQHNDMSILDPDFWTEGFTIREAVPEVYVSEGAPLLLDLTASHVLRAGKAVGLLRILDIPLTIDARPMLAWMADWPTFTALLQGQHAGALVETSKEHLSRFIYDTILPRCQIPQKRLAQIMVSECDLWLHLTAIEELYFMRRSDVMSYFSDVLFSKMDSQQTWSDFHFLNKTFRDILEGCSTNWIETALVRFSYSGSRDKALRPTIDALDDLLVEYAAPFPLTYLFGLHISGTYRSVFVFLLQLRRAKNVLENARIWDTTTRRESKRSLNKIVFAMRSKLIWFINTLLDFIATHVIHRQLSTFHASLKLAESLDEMISLHDSHLQKLGSECMLQSDTAALRQAILSIVNLALHFRNMLTANAEEATEGAQTLPRIGSRLHRSRRGKQARKNAIGFSLSLQEAIQTSDSESDLEEEETSRLGTFNSRYYRMPENFGDGRQLSDDIDEMQDELDRLVRFIHRDAERLAGSVAGATSAFSVLAFALEDWKR